MLSEEHSDLMRKDVAKYSNPNLLNAIECTVSLLGIFNQIGNTEMVQETNQVLGIMYDEKDRRRDEMLEDPEKMKKFLGDLKEELTTIDSEQISLGYVGLLECLLLDTLSGNDKQVKFLTPIKEVYEAELDKRNLSQPDKPKQPDFYTIHRN